MGREKIVWAKHDWSKGTEESVLRNCEDGGVQYAPCTQSSMEARVRRLGEKHQGEVTECSNKELSSTCGVVGAI